jgi:hypothetical protein
MRRLAAAGRRSLPFLLLFCGVGRLAADVRDNLSRASGLPDFRIYRLAGRAVLHGQSPYAQLGRIHSVASAGFVYPAPAAWAMAPFGLLGFRTAAVLFVLLATAAALAALRLLGVRDLRCYGAALLLMPVSTAITTGTVSTFLLLAAAVVWRFRERTVVPAAVLAAALLLKPLLWPLAVWLAATRRWRSAALTAAAAAAGTGLAYAFLHLDPLASYPRLVRAATAAEGADSYSLYALLARAGAPAPLVVAEAAAAPFAAVLWLFARRDERRGFTAAIAATLALAPILWVNAFVLLLVPIAFARPRLAWLWALPVLLGPLGLHAYDPPAASLALVWVVAAAAFAQEAGARRFVRLRGFERATVAASAVSAESRSTATAPAGVMQ